MEPSGACLMRRYDAPFAHRSWPSGESRLRAADRGRQPALLAARCPKTIRAADFPAQVPATPWSPFGCALYQLLVLHRASRAGASPSGFIGRTERTMRWAMIGAAAGLSALAGCAGQGPSLGGFPGAQYD